MKPKGEIFVITAPSGTGKTTLIHAIRERVRGIGYCVSHTTREPREGEKEGNHYYFLTRAEFEQMVDERQFVEWANVYGHLYGTSSAGMKRALSSGSDLLLDVDIQGAEAIKEHFPESHSVFILPPSMHVLEQRLHGRATEDQEDADIRIKKAEEEINRCKEYDFIVINDDFSQAVHEMEAIIVSQRARTKRRYPLIQDRFHLR